MAPMVGLRAALASFALVFACAPAARAATTSDRPAATEATGFATPKRAGFEILASAGYGASMADIGKLELEPYAASFALDFGYVFRSGFRVGGYAGYGLGRTISQRREALIGEDLDLEVNASSLK